MFRVRAKRGRFETLSGFRVNGRLFDTKIFSRWFGWEVWERLLGAIPGDDVRSWR